MTDPGKPVGEAGEVAVVVEVGAEGDEEEQEGEEEVGEGEDQGDPQEGTSCHGDKRGCYAVTFISCSTCFVVSVKL